MDILLIVASAVSVLVSSAALFFSIKRLDKDKII
jgi:hypothetical protein